MKRLNADDSCCIVVLLGLTVLVGLDPAADAFFYATSAGTALMVIAALCRREMRKQFFLLGFLLPLSLIGTTAANHLVVQLTPHTIDGALGRLDGGWSVRFYHGVLPHRHLREVLEAVYYGLPLYSALILFLSGRRFEYARAWIVAAIPAPLFFVAFPATGPAHVTDPVALRNCIPSLHMTWALLAVVYTSPRWRAIAVIFAALTAAATIGIGEHYVIDLVVAVPYTWATCRVVSRTRQLWPNLLSQPASAHSA